jgi:hypothetical protein
MRNLIYVAITPMLFVTSIIFDFNLLLSLIFFFIFGIFDPYAFGLGFISSLLIYLGLKSLLLLLLYYSS